MPNSKSTSNSKAKLQIINVDYHNPQHERDLLHLLNIYAQDPMGGGQALPNAVRKQLCSKLANIEGAFSLIAYSDSQAVALATCFESFSTFYAKKLINIHDFMVVPEYRGQGISQLLLAKIEELAKSRDCCKVTLEVLSGNNNAKQAYLKFGFKDYELDPKQGSALFWEKRI